MCKGSSHLPGEDCGKGLGRFRLLTGMLPNVSRLQRARVDKHNFHLQLLNCYLCKRLRKALESFNPTSKD